MDVLSRVRAGITAARHDLPTRSVNTHSDSQHLSATLEWLCQSQDVTTTDGSAATYNLVLGWQDAYPETTGYIIPTLLSYAEAKDEPKIADRAIRMADWLRSIQKQSGSFPAGTGTVGEPSVFNTGQIVFGLVAAYRETGDDRYRRAVRDACDWLVDQQTSAGYWKQYDYKNEVHSYSTRVGWALLEGGEIVSDRIETYQDAARRNFQWAIKLQRPNGWFAKAAFESGSAPYLHTIAYTVRGLLEGGLILDDNTIFEAAKRTADELLFIQQSEGILKGAFDSSWSPSWYYCLTGNAQTAVIWLRLFAETGETGYWTGARETIDFLKRRQILDGPPEVRGALAGSYPLFGPYMYLRFPNWAAKFFVDALLLAREYDSTDSDRLN